MGEKCLVMVAKVWRALSAFIEEKANFLNFALLAIGISALMTYVNQTDPHGEFHFLRGMASWYIVIGAALLIFGPKRWTLVRVFSWSILGAGALFYTIDSAFWYLWIPMAIGAFIQAWRTAGGYEE